MMHTWWLKSKRIFHSLGNHLTSCSCMPYISICRWKPVWKTRPSTSWCRSRKRRSRRTWASRTRTSRQVFTPCLTTAWHRAPTPYTRMSWSTAAAFPSIRTVRCQWAWAVPQPASPRWVVRCSRQFCLVCSRGGEINCPCCPCRTFLAPDK